MGREEFISKYRHELELNQEQRRQGEVASRNQTRDNSKGLRYTAPKGTARRAQKSKRKLNVKLAALILAATIGVGSISLINTLGPEQPEPITITKIQQDGVNAQSLGLSSETIALFEKYDKYFEDSNSTYNLTDEEILSIISDIEGLHFSVVKEKMADLLGEDPSDITMYYAMDRADGVQSASVILNEGSYDEQSYQGYMNEVLFDFSNSDRLPKELAQIIWQLDSLGGLESRLKTDKISQVNAIKELKELYENLEEVATGEFVQDEKGNITIMDYEPNSRQQDDDREID